MSYVKLPFANENYVLGYQTINQSRDNLDAVHDGFIAEHTDANRRVGQHDTQNIPRDIVQVYGLTSLSLFIPTQINVSGGRYVSAGGAVRAGVGQYFIPILGLSEFWGQPAAKVTSSASIPLIVARSYYPTALPAQGLGQGITITCYEMSSGALVATNFDFTLAVYGNA